jgi:hypothetical protein
MTDKKGEAPDGSAARAPGWPAVVGTLGAAAGALAGLLALPSHRLLSAALFFLAAIFLAAVWSLTRITETQWFRHGIKVAAIITLAGVGIYFVVTPAAGAGVPSHGRPAPHAPRLDFVDGTAATVPFCRSYTVLTSSQVPAGFKIAMFDAATDAEGNVTSNYSFDGVAAPTAAYRFGVPLLSVGPSRGARGFTAVVVAALVSDQYARLLTAIVADPGPWLIKVLPPALRVSRLKVTRAAGYQPCP